MQRPDDPAGLGGRLVVSASDLVWFKKCRHRTALDRSVMEGAQYPTTDGDAFSQVLKRQGIEHELAYLEHLRTLHGPDGVADCSTAGTLDDQVAATTAAIAAGVPVIYQAALMTPDPVTPDVLWRGHADFIIANDHGVYEPYDTKLGRTVQSSWVQQLAVYANQLALLQGRKPSAVYVVSPSDTGFHVTTVEAAHPDADVTDLEQALVASLVGPQPATQPDKVQHCTQCKWKLVCDDARRTARDLSLVHGMRAAQVTQLRAADVGTIDDLAALHGQPAPPPVAGIGVNVVSRLAHQAALQVRSEQTGRIEWEFSPDLLTTTATTTDLRSVHAPVPGDLYFDIEGTNRGPAGLAYYLFGVAGVSKRFGRTRVRFTPFWATTASAQLPAFTDLVGFITSWRQRYPHARIYHYNHYERTALLALGQRTPALAEAVADICDNALVDLYPIVRSSLVVGAESYGLKALEPLLGITRRAGVTDAVSSMAEFDQYLQTGDTTILNRIERYNHDDVIATRLLHQWLWDRNVELERLQSHR